MAPSSNQLESKIVNSKLNNETKEILSLIMSFFSELLQAKDSRVSELEDQVTSLEKKVEKLESSVDEASQYERRDTIVISGQSIPIVNQGENCKTIVRNLFRQHLNMNIDENDISTAHRIGRQQTGTTDKRNIIVKLCRRDLVHDIYASCKAVKPPFYVNDSLTPIRNKICYMLRQLKKKFPGKVKGCTSFNGVPRIYLSTMDGPSTRQRSTSRTSHKGINIATRLELEQFVKDVFDTTLHDISLSW